MIQLSERDLCESQSKITRPMPELLEVLRALRIYWIIRAF